MSAAAEIVRTDIILPRDLRDRAAEQARAQDRSFASYVRLALQAALEADAHDRRVPRRYTEDGERP